MSHYAVAVFANDADFDRLLAPYDENNRDEFEFVPVDYQDICESFEKFKEQNKHWTIEMYTENMGYIQKDGQWGYEHNPHGYWDWYSLDGKDYMFDLKKGCTIDSDEWPGCFRKNDYEWFKEDREAVLDGDEFWDTFVAKQNDEEYPSFFSRQYYLDRYKTKEQYLKEIARTIPYAFITPDGVWHSAGRVGWFAMSNETAEDADRYAAEWEAYIRSDENPYVNLVDCHI